MLFLCFGCYLVVGYKWELVGYCLIETGIVFIDLYFGEVLYLK